jgi:alanyl-tRNA synthetase
VIGGSFRCDRVVPNGVALSGSGSRSHGHRSGATSQNDEIVIAFVGRHEARKGLEADSRALNELAALLKAPAGQTIERVEALIEERRRLERELAEARRKLAMGGGAADTDAARDVAGVKLYARAVSGVEVKDLKSLADEAKQNVGSGVVAIAAKGEDGKASIVVAVTPDLTGRFNAIDLVRLGSAALGGKGGGGRPDMAQAGGPDGAKTREALAAVEAGVRRAAAGA